MSDDHYCVCGKMFEHSGVCAEPVRLADHDWRERPHHSKGLHCCSCDERFVGVYPVTRVTVSLECPNCGKFTVADCPSEEAYKAIYWVTWPPRGKGTRRYPESVKA